MGLNGIVYRNRRSLPFDPEQAGAALDARTGEFYFQDSAQEKRFNGGVVVAVSRHLGNVNTVDSLSQAVERSLGRQDSLLQNRVLFSGTHAGDVIEPAQFDQLGAEIEEVRKSPMADQVPGLAKFIRSMGDLLEAALEEGNPIVFT
jgi:hypothetical protein